MRKHKTPKESKLNVTSDEIMCSLCNHERRNQGDHDQGVKELMPESLLNYRFRGTTPCQMKGSLIALENIIIHKVTTHSVLKVKKIDTSAPMEIGMAAGIDGEDEGTGKHPNLQCKQVDGMEERVPVGVHRNTSTAERVNNGRVVLESDRGPGPEAGKEEKGKEKVGDFRDCSSCGKTGHIAEGELEQESERCGRSQRRHQRGSA